MTFARKDKGLNDEQFYFFHAPFPLSLTPFNHPLLLHTSYHNPNHSTPLHLNSLSTSHLIHLLFPLPTSSLNHLATSQTTISSKYTRKYIKIYPPAPIFFIPPRNISNNVPQSKQSQPPTFHSPSLSQIDLYPLPLLSASSFLLLPLLPPFTSLPQLHHQPTIHH